MLKTPRRYSAAMQNVQAIAATGFIIWFLNNSVVMALTCAVAIHYVLFLIAEHVQGKNDE